MFQKLKQNARRSGNNIHFYGSQWVCSLVFVVTSFFFVYFLFENRNVFKIYQDQEREALKTFNVIMDAKNEKHSGMGLIKFAVGCTKQAY